MIDSKIIAFAIDAHNKVNHLYNGYPYSVHLAMVVGFAQDSIDVIPDQCQSDVMNACWLHDTIEDCRLTYNDIKKASNEAVADIVYAVTNEKGKNRAERANDTYYKGIRNTQWATYVKLCDRLANVKYSKDTDSIMFDVYKNEHESFVNHLFKNESEVKYYKGMLALLTHYFNS
jgi:(p)ppGpp synthase/HD superfamily hydrolase